ncbi:hypothetical protein QBC35DRAFT_51309 [Podospora australis]|uniref:Uncharacterized protein n=1 Tax=Podospora australis TaxID=1536484 RepID=A0AAN6WMB8_9PEZI|nr:hypothetical protein QBC35DRAFT_51309 [Podospora australis]
MNLRKIMYHLRRLLIILMLAVWYSGGPAASAVIAENGPNQDYLEKAPATMRSVVELQPHEVVDVPHFKSVRATSSSLDANQGTGSNGVTGGGKTVIGGHGVVVLPPDSGIDVSMDGKKGEGRLVDVGSGDGGVVQVVPGLDTTVNGQPLS